jgi:hypothetical protein
MKKSLPEVFVAGFLLFGCAHLGAERDAEGGKMDSKMGKEALIKVLKAKRAKFKDIEVSVDLNGVSEEDKRVLWHLLQAADVMDLLFFKQASKDGLSIYEHLKTHAETEYERLLLELVEINFGVYDRLEDHKPFIETKDKPLGAEFYPADMTKEEFESFLKAHEDKRDAFISPYTVIRRGKNGELESVPYSEFYKDDLERAARHLEAAAKETRDEALKRFLLSRAQAFRTNDYFQSECDWVDLHSYKGEGKSAIEITIGPYEVYEDRLFNYKASFEAFVGLVDEKESAKLSLVSSFLDELEANLPIEARYKNFGRGQASPIVVVNLLYSAGDTKAGVQTTAYNLPNDEKVREAKGSKKVLLKNVGRAKFEASLVPIARRVLDPTLFDFVDFDAYFNDVLMHEVSHGLGPGIITALDGSKVQVNVALKETYSTVEECKADVVGLWASFYLIKKGIFPQELGKRIMATMLAGLFRSMRFGVSEAHGLANLIEYNFFKEEGCIAYDEKGGRFSVVEDKFVGCVEGLARRLLTIEATGDYEGAKGMIEKFGKMPPEVAEAIKRLEDIPVDIKPIYSSAHELRRAMGKWWMQFVNDKGGEDDKE